jgi:hypothetical protein
VSRSNCSSNLDPPVKRCQLGREHEPRQAEVPPGDHSREDRGHDRRHPLRGLDPVDHAVVFSIRNSIIGMRSKSSAVSSSVVYTAMIAWSVGEPGKSTDTCTCAISRGLSVGTWSKNCSVVMLLSWVAVVSWSGPLAEKGDREIG